MRSSADARSRAPLMRGEPQEWSRTGAPDVRRAMVAVGGSWSELRRGFRCVPITAGSRRDEIPGEPGV